VQLARTPARAICLALAFVCCRPAAAADRRYDPVLGPGWELIGGFSGTTGSTLRRIIDHSMVGGAGRPPSHHG
jgi:hypothetical protein